MTYLILSEEGLFLQWRQISANEAVEILKGKKSLVLQTRLDKFLRGGGGSPAPGPNIPRQKGLQVRESPAGQRQMSQWERKERTPVENDPWKISG